MLKALVAALPIETPTIFPDSVIAGITLRAVERFPPRGFSLEDPTTPTPAAHLLAATLGVPWERLKFQHQVHSALVRWVHLQSPIETSDGMITDQPGLILCVRVADCCAVLLFCPEPPVIAALHAGWRGIAAGIVETGLGELLRIGCPPERILAYLSPCASAERYVVRADVAQLFPQSAFPVDGQFYRLDLRGDIRRRLCALGLRETNIELSRGCTLSDPRYHSFRRDGNAAGRMVAFIGMHPLIRKSSTVSGSRMG